MSAVLREWAPPSRAASARGASTAAAALLVVLAACTGVLIDEKPNRGDGKVGKGEGRAVERVECRDGTPAEDICFKLAECAEESVDGAKCALQLSAEVFDDGALESCAQCWARGKCAVLLEDGCEDACPAVASLDRLRTFGAGGGALDGSAPEGGTALSLCKPGEVPHAVGIAADDICAKFRECLGEQLDLTGCADEIAARVAWDGVPATAVLACALCHEAATCADVTSGRCEAICSEQGRASK